MVKTSSLSDGTVVETKRLESLFEITEDGEKQVLSRGKEV
jgi:hypothetical protein